MENKIIDYNASNIELLEGLEGVRKRPAMYIGSTNTYGLHHLVREIVDNAVDEALNGYGKRIFVVIHKDNSVTVTDEGRGIPCDIHEKTGIPAIQLILSTLHSGGKFNDKSYKSSAGLHGVGSSVTNALSEYFDATVLKDGKIYHIAFENGGRLKTPLEVLGTTTRHGTTISFKPDGKIFSTTDFNFERIANHLQESAFLLKGVHFYLSDERTGQKADYCYEEGLKEYMEELSLNKKPIGDVMYINDNQGEVELEIAFRYFYEDYSENIKSYVNNIHTIDGGTHETGFKLGITRAVNDYIENNNLNKTKNKLEGNDIREGLTALISLRLPPDSMLEFEGQTKGRLATQAVVPIINNLVYTKFSYYLNENKEFALNLVKKCQMSQNARLAARKAKEEARNSKKGKDAIILSDKLTPAQSKQYALNELFIVEGDSAGGSAKKGRDPKYQAILPLRGKPLNCDGLPKEKVLANLEFATIINTIGAGYGPNFDIEDCRYGKIIIMSDADTDGAHIQTLLLTFFYNYMKPLITNGKVFIAIPPLYRVFKKDSKGKTIEKYCYNDDDLQVAKNEIGAGYSVSRYKGLGEMSDKQLRDTTMDKEHRVLLKVSINDVALVEKKIDVLMGKDSQKRKVWLEHAVDFSEKDDFINEVK